MCTNTQISGIIHVNLHNKDPICVCLEILLNTNYRALQFIHFFEINYDM